MRTIGRREGRPRCACSTPQEGYQTHTQDFPMRDALANPDGDVGPAVGEVMNKNDILTAAISVRAERPRTH